MQVMTLEVRFHAPFCHSLKDKRAVVKSLLAKARNRFNVSAAETGAQDDAKTLVLGFAACAAHAAQADSVAENLLRFLQANTEAEVVSVEKQLY